MRHLVKIYKSNTSIEAQILELGNTLAGKKYKFSKTKDAKPIDEADGFGQDFGKLLKDKKITAISFDRNKSRYHGKVKAFAEGMRKAGIEF